MRKINTLIGSHIETNNERRRKKKPTLRGNKNQTRKLAQIMKEIAVAGASITNAIQEITDLEIQQLTAKADEDIKNFIINNQ